MPKKETIRRTPPIRLSLGSPLGVTSTVDTDNATGDAFGRLRVSEPVTQLDLKQLYDGLPLLYDDAETSGSGTTSTYNTNKASTTLGVADATAGVRVKQSKMRGFYQPGKGMLMLLTAVMGSSEAGMHKRVGYFDDNNGLFFEHKDGTLGVVSRTYTSGAAVDTKVDQSSWNVDKLDGTGPSGITLDVTKTNIFVIDFEWLGVGRVRFGVNVDGVTYYCHELLNANSLTLVYMSTPNLPLRFEIGNSGAASDDTLTAICGTIVSEGGNDDIIKPVVAARDATALSMSSSSGVYVPVTSIRLKSAQIGARINPEEISVFVTTSNVDFHWKLVLNPAIAGVDAASWSGINSSSIEYDISRDNTNTVSGGYELAHGYGSTTNQVQMPITGSNRSYLTLGSDIDGTVDEMVLCVAQAGTTVGTPTAYGGIRVGEYI
jgi:hypothetical protein